LRLLVFGATGGTGRQVVGLALEQGHRVTAFARRPGAVTSQHANLAVFTGDVLDAAAVSEAVAGHDVVISALGTREGDDWILPQATDHICIAMKELGVGRIICVSTLGVGESRAQLGPIFGVLAADLPETLAEKEAQEQVIRESGLDWIIVRPGALTDSPRTGVYRCVTDPAVLLPRAWISRADVADFILKHLAGDEYVHQAVSLAY
jgi:putative NADH-flavin reductase